METRHSKMIEFARSLDFAVSIGGINWDWFYFSSEESAKVFKTYLQKEGFEYGGGSNPRNDRPEMNIKEDACWGIRYR